MKIVAFFRGISKSFAYYFKRGESVEDWKMVDAIRENQESGIETLKRQYDSMIKYVMAPILSDSRDIEECLADVYIKLWQNIDQFDPRKGSLKNWISVIARNTAITIARKNARKEMELKDTYPSKDTPEDNALKESEISELRRAINSLRETDRQLVYRRYFYMQGIPQIAAELGMTERAVEGRLYRIRRKLKNFLGGEGVEGGR